MSIVHDYKSIAAVTPRRKPRTPRKSGGGAGQTRAEHNIEWCERLLRIPEGQFVGQPLKMADYMKDDFRAIYDNPHGTRRAIITRGRKNAKSTECAMILLLHLCGPEAKPNSQLFSAAQSRDQAALIFALAAKMIRLSPDLQAVATIRDTAKQIYCAELGTLYRALSAEASTAFGLSPLLTIHDELGQVRGPRSELYEALETATAAQADPLSITISTQAPTEADLLSTLIHDAKSGRDPRMVLRMHSAGEELDPFSVEAIRAANPAFDLFMNQREVLDMMENAKAMPSRQAEYENLVLNRQVESFSPFVARKLWESCGGDVIASFDGKPIYAGLDLSEVNDLTALVMIAAHDGAWHVKPTFWLPREGLRERSRADRVPYDQWAGGGFIETTPGRSIEYEYIAEHLRGLFDRFGDNMRQVAFDRWNWRHFRPWLVKAGFSDQELERFVEFGQGYQSMSPALRDLESALLTSKVAHGNHPVLTMCAANAVVQPDPAGNRKLSKARSRGRIDGLVSLAMAVSVAATEDLTAVKPKYQMLFV